MGRSRTGPGQATRCAAEDRIKAAGQELSRTVADLLRYRRPDLADDSALDLGEIEGRTGTP